MPTDLPDAAGATDVPGYRPVSGLAVFALIAGMLSATAVFSPALLVVPLIASALAVAALKDVSPRGDGEERNIVPADASITVVRATVAADPTLLRRR